MTLLKVSSLDGCMANTNVNLAADSYSLSAVLLPVKNDSLITDIKANMHDSEDRGTMLAEQKQSYSKHQKQKSQNVKSQYLLSSNSSISEKEHHTMLSSQDTEINVSIFKAAKELQVLTKSVEAIPSYLKPTKNSHQYQKQKVDTDKPRFIFGRSNAKKFKYEPSQTSQKNVADDLLLQPKGN